MKNKDGFNRSSLLAYLPFLLLAILPVIAFSNLLRADFLCDDLLHLDYLWRAFSLDPSLLWAPFYSPWLKDVSFYNFYRPLTELSLAGDYLLYGTGAAGYHLTSIIWHLTNVWLFFILTKKLITLPAFYIAGARERAYLSFLSAALWSVYPTHSEAIGWIAARSDLMATCFYLSTMIFFISDLTNRTNIKNPWRQWPSILVVLPMVLGFFTKELIISLPFVLFALAWFVQGNQKPDWLKRIKQAADQSLFAFVLLFIYICGRALAIGDLIGGYAGSIGDSLNQSLVDRWLLSPSFFKIFHPLNDRLIDKDHWVRSALRLLWGACGLTTLVSARVGGAIITKYRFLLFAFTWLFLTLLPNLQVWGFSAGMAGGRIAYLPTLAISWLIVFAVYPIGASILSNGKMLLLKAVSLTTLTTLIVIFASISIINNRAWVQASQAVHKIGEQLNDLTDELGPGQRLALLNLPTTIKGAYAFTSLSMVNALVKQPFNDSNQADSIMVLDAQPCSYPLVGFSDTKNVAARADLFKFYYWDAEAKKLVRAGQSLLAASGLGKSGNAARNTFLDLHDQEEKSENFRFLIAPILKPAHYRFARLRLTLSKQAIFKNSADTKNKEAVIGYLWDNRPVDEDDERQSFCAQLMTLPGRGETKDYLIRLGEHKLWLLSPGVNYMQIFIPALNDPTCRADLSFIPGDSVAPKLTARVESESEGDSLLSLKHLGKNSSLKLYADAKQIKGVSSLKIEMLPPYYYFDHYVRKMPAPAFCPKTLKVFTLNQSSGAVQLTGADFPRPGIYQFRACAVDSAGAIIGDFSETVTVTVTANP